MFQEYRKELDWGGAQAHPGDRQGRTPGRWCGVVTYGETKVLCTAVGEHTPRPGLTFFPLTVNYQEKAFAAGKIPGGFFKREGRPSEKETLVCRLIDRPIRPLFVKGFKCETQVICTVLSMTWKTDPDVVALIGASAALTLSGLPFRGPLGACRVGYVNGDFVLNPQWTNCPLCNSTWWSPAPRKAC